MSIFAIAKKLAMVNDARKKSVYENALLTFSLSRYINPLDEKRINKNRHADNSIDCISMNKKSFKETNF